MLDSITHIHLRLVNQVFDHRLNAQEYLLMWVFSLQYERLEAITQAKHYPLVDLIDQSGRCSTLVLKFHLLDENKTD